MPAKGKSRVTPAQKAKIAAGRAAGKRSKEIAQAAGVSVSTVEHQAAKPEVQTLIARLKHRDEKQLERIWKGTLDGIERDIKAKHPDIRRHARTQALKAITAGDAPLARLEPGDGGQGEFTLEELLVVYRRASAKP